MYVDTGQVRLLLFVQPILNAEIKIESNLEECLILNPHQNCNVELQNFMNLDCCGSGRPRQQLIN